jgi:enterochelin esterase-like enzyme
MASIETFQPKITLLHAMTHPTLFGRVFAVPSFWTWRTVAKLIDGTPLSCQSS